MQHESDSVRDWNGIVEQLGGDDALAASARQTKAFLRAREIKSAADLLRLLLAYCLGDRGLRSTAAWAAAVDLVDVSNVAILYRLRRSGDWLAHLVGVAALGLRLVAVRKPPEGREIARRKARREAQRGGHTLAKATLIAADWVIIVTSLAADAY